MSGKSAKQSLIMEVITIGGETAGVIAKSGDVYLRDGFELRREISNDQDVKFPHVAKFSEEEKYFFSEFKEPAYFGQTSGSKYAFRTYGRIFDDRIEFAPIDTDFESLEYEVMGCYNRPDGLFKIVKFKDGHQEDLPYAGSEFDEQDVTSARSLIVYYLKKIMKREDIKAMKHLTQATAVEIFGRLVGLIDKANGVFHSSVTTLGNYSMEKNIVVQEGAFAELHYEMPVGELCNGMERNEYPYLLSLLPEHGLILAHIDPERGIVRFPRARKFQTRVRLANAEGSFRLMADNGDTVKLFHSYLGMHNRILFNGFSKIPSSDDSLCRKFSRNYSRLEGCFWTLFTDRIRVIGIDMVLSEYFPEYSCSSWENRTLVFDEDWMEKFGKFARPKVDKAAEICLLRRGALRMLLNDYGGLNVVDLQNLVADFVCENFFDDLVEGSKLEKKLEEVYKAGFFSVKSGYAKLKPFAKVIVHLREKFGFDF
jgi:hypothetical protein